LTINLDKNNILWLFLFIFLCLIFGNGIGGYFTFVSVETWYQTLNKPNFNPPDWVFGPVWTTLYILMGVSIWLIWKKETSKIRTISMIIFWVQFFFNIFWTYLFFGIQRIDLGLFEIFFLIFLILINIIYFYKIDKIASYLLVPYVLWVSYASILNYKIWVLN
jgi:tryptophan-rich sensory protein